MTGHWYGARRGDCFAIRVTWVEKRAGRPRALRFFEMVLLFQVQREGGVFDGVSAKVPESHMSGILELGCDPVGDTTCGFLFEVVGFEGFFDVE